MALNSQRSISLWLLSARIKGVCHHFLTSMANWCGWLCTLIFRQALFVTAQTTCHYISPLLSKVKKKAITNVRKTIYNKYSNYIQYIQAINISTISSPFAFDKFRENTPYLSCLFFFFWFFETGFLCLSCLDVSKRLYVIHFLFQFALSNSFTLFTSLVSFFSESGKQGKLL